MSSSSSSNAPLHSSLRSRTEERPATGEGTFNLPPLELAARPTVMNWRGVRFGDVALGLYYENDSWEILRDVHHDNVCSKTGKPPEIDENILRLMYKHSPALANWDNMTAVSAQYFLFSCVSLGEAKKVIGEGFSNSVPIEDAYYSNFHMPADGEGHLYDLDGKFGSDSESEESRRERVNDEYATLTLAVSYTHQVKQSNNLLKANQFQIDQLEQILSAIRENPPANTKFVRLWTDGAHSKKMGTIKPKDHPKWILHGLLPYAVFPVAWLRSGDDTDNASMWCCCEQILGDGALGCLFPLLPRVRPKIPPFGKLRYSGNMESKSTIVVKTVGDGLSINRNLTKLAAAIHSGVLDDTVTYHIGDAQELIRLAYYMTRQHLVSMIHAINCEECLHATFRESMGFVRALHICCDLFDETDDQDLRLRLNKTQISYAYPLVRARRGFVDWHGLRELVPGAGRFVKVIVPFFFEKYKKNMHIVSLYNNNLVATTHCLLISAYPCSDGPIRYIVLLVHGRHLFTSSCQINWSVRLNIIDLAKLHHGVQKQMLSGKVSELFRHPEMDQLLSQFEFRVFHATTEVSWGAWGLEKSSKEDEEQKPVSDFLSAKLSQLDKKLTKWYNARKTQ